MCHMTRKFIFTYTVVTIIVTRLYGTSNMAQKEDLS